MARHRVPGLSVARLEGGEVVEAWGHGDTGGPEPAPVTASTLFPACSVSKFVTALGVMRLVQDGRVDLDRDVNEQLRSWRLPDTDGLTGPVTLRHVLGHVAGLAEFRHPGYRRGAPLPTLPQILDGAKPANTPAVRRERPAGGEFRYSCGNFSVIQQLVADVTGLPFAQAMRELVLDPLGMSASGFTQDLPERRPGEVAHGHDADGRPIAGGWWVFPEQASSGFWCTATDLAAVSREIVRAAAGEGAVFLSREVAAEMVTPLTESYGLGTAVSRDGATHWFGHPGDKKSHQCFTATDLHTGDGLVVLANIGGDAPLTAGLLHELGVRIRYLIG
jgi:CubicO group peptidase (beta-lactamase class C family)